MKKETKKAILVILDGWGMNKNSEVSAVEKANTPFMDSLYQNYPSSTLITYGKEVGLPEGQMGNSEVGHLNLGAGRVVFQNLMKINNSIKENSLKDNENLVQTLNYAKENNKTVHLIGLLSDGGVHSHTSHLYELIKIADHMGVSDTQIHAFTDGRDVDPKSGIEYVKKLTEFIQPLKAELSSIIGRYYAMDRDKRWERIKKAYDLLVNNTGHKYENPIKAIEDSYANNITDEFIEPISLSESKINEGDVVIAFNFRTDRCRQITEVLTQNDMPNEGMKKLDLKYLTMTVYDSSFKGVDVIFQEDKMKNTLGEVIQNEGKTQLRIAETEKYPHVTFFFSGGIEEPYNGEERILCPSPKVATYDLQPEMSAEEIKDKAIVYIQQKQPDFICLNFANADMVGHTGIMEAAVKACEKVDECLKELTEKALEFGYQLIVIADHGNADVMKNTDGSPNTAHTVNPVPVVLVGSEYSKIKEGKLADIAPTILTIMNLHIPTEMTGKVLV